RRTGSVGRAPASAPAGGTNRAPRGPPGRERGRQPRPRKSSSRSGGRKPPGPRMHRERRGRPGGARVRARSPDRAPEPTEGRADCYWVNLAEVKVVWEVPNWVCTVPWAGLGLEITAVGSTMDIDWMASVRLTLLPVLLPPLLPLPLPPLPLPVASVMVTLTK